MNDNEAQAVNRWLQKSISANDILRQFHGNPLWLTVIKVTPKMNVMTKVLYKTTRTYDPRRQKDEIIMDMFDISQSHRIIGINYPWGIYFMECDSEHPDTNIDADMIEAIVGKIGGEDKKPRS